MESPVALGHEYYCGGKEQSCGDDSEIIGGQRGDLCRSPREADKQPASAHRNHSENCGEQKSRCQRGGHLLSQGLVVLSAEILGHQDGRTHGNSHNQKDKDIHHRPCGSDGSQGLFAVKLSDYHRIYGVVELLEQIAEYQGNRVGEHVPCNISLGHIPRHKIKPP